MKQFYVMAVLDLVGRMVRWGNDNMNRFFRKLWFRRVQYLRIFLFCSWGPQTKASQPYVKLPSGKFDLNEFSPEFFEQLKRLAEMAYQWQVALYVDMFDNCALAGYLNPDEFHPYENNINLVRGMYDESSFAQDYRNKLFDKVIETIGLQGKFKGLVLSRKIRPNLFGWNEVKCRDTKQGRDNFGKKWAYPQASHWRKKGYKGKIMFSAYDPAAHAIQGWVSSDEYWQSEFKRGDTVRQFHVMTDINWAKEKCNMTVHGRWFATSTDGTFNRNPTIDTVVEIIKYAIARSKERKRLRKERHYHSHEELPLSISEINELIWEIEPKRDLEVWSAISRRVFNIHPANRKVPKWLLRRTGI